MFRLPNLMEERSWGAWLSHHVGLVFVGMGVVLASLGALILGLVELEITVAAQGVLEEVDGEWIASLEVPRLSEAELSVGQELLIRSLEAGPRREGALRGTVRSVGRSLRRETEPTGPEFVHLTVLVHRLPETVAPSAGKSPVAGRLVIGKQSAGQALLRGFRRQGPGGDGL